MPAERWRRGLLLWAVVASSAQAGDAPADAQSSPDLDFLEYLGSLVRADDGWLDASDLRRPEEAEQDRRAAAGRGVLPPDTVEN